MKGFQMGNVLWFLLILNLDLFEHVGSAEENEIIVNGDLMIIALFPIHRKSDTSGSCEQIQEFPGIQRAEVALKTIEKLREEKKGSCSLGIVIKDTCGGKCVAVDDLKTFNISQGNIAGIIGPVNCEKYWPRNSDSLNFHPRDPWFPPNLHGQSDNYNPRSYNYIKLVSSDLEQLKVIISIVRKLKYSGVNVIGLSGHENNYFDEAGKEEKVCIHEREDESKKNFSYILSSTVKTTQVIVCFCDGETLRRLLLEAKKMNASEKFIFIASDEWTERDDVVKDLKAEAAGNFFINLKAKSSKNYKFDNTYTNLLRQKEENKNQWIDEFYKYRFNCTFDRSDEPTIKQCTGNEVRPSKPENFQDPKLQFLIESIEEIDEKREMNCKQLNKTEKGIYNYPEYEYDRLLGHRYIFGRSNFDEKPNDRDYEILNLQDVNGDLKFVRVGTWENGMLTWNDSVPIPKIDKIRSHCHDTCRPGQYVNKTLCCWKCEKCERNNYTNTGDKEKCIPCDIKLMANENKTDCIPKNDERIYWYQPDALMCIFVSAFGILITLYSAFKFYNHLETPIVKNSSPELSLIIFNGMILSHTYILILVMYPEQFICTLARIVPSISLTMIYGPLLVRINRISRAFTVTKLREPYLEKQYFTTKFLIQLTICIIAAELCMIFIVDNLVFSDIEVYKHNPQFDDKIMKFCKKDNLNQFNSRQLINVLLLAYCCVFGCKTIRLPDNFHESKFVVSSCGTTAIIWIIYLLIFTTSSDEPPRRAAISLSLVLSANSLISLAGFFFPKLYIILWRPKNYETYFSTENRLQRTFAQIESMKMTDISLWEYLGVASRVTPEVLEQTIQEKS